MKKPKQLHEIPLLRNFIKLMFIMKLCFFLILATGLQVTAKSFSQDKISVDFQNVKLDKALKVVQQKSDYRFVYSSLKLPNDSRITYRGSELPVKVVLDALLNNTDLRYVIMENQLVVISKKEAVAPPPITGKVTNEKGEPLANVTVQVKGSERATITGADGTFSIDVDGNARTLIFSFVDMVSQEVPIRGKTNLSVTLQALDKSLGEVVIVGYGSKTKSNVLQGISTINAKKVAEIPVANLAQALTGRIPGLYITQGGGKPGRVSDIKIRAYDGFGASRPPLFVIDGIILDQFAFDGLDANEVENISVLKDGAAASIYGARAANGVILVTTKKGQSGKPKINFITSYGIDEATKVPATLNAYDQAIFQNDYLKQTDPTNYLNNADFFADDELEYFKTHSWNLIDQYFKRPTTARYSLNLSGGSDRVNYFLGGSYFNGTGSFDNLEFQKFNYRAKVEAKVTTGLTVSINVSSDIRNDEKPYWRYDGDGDDFTDLYRNTLLRSKMSPDYIMVDGKNYPVGNFLKWHPGEVINGNTGYNRKKFTNNEVLLDVNYELPFMKGLKLRSSFGKYSRNDFRKELNTPYKLYVFNSAGSKRHLVGDKIDFTQTFDRNDGDWIAETYANSEFYQFNFFANYDRKIGNHNIAAMVGYEQYESKNQNFRAQNQFVISNTLDQLSLASSDSKDFSVSGGQFEDGRLAYLGRLSYNFANQYFVEGSFRYEGSRYFTPENRYGIFPSVSAGWRISEASFFRNNIKFINDLKFRGSYGVTGDDVVSAGVGNLSGQLQWSQSYRKVAGAVFGGGGTNGVTPGTIPNPEITWAKKKSVDLGFDAAFFNSKLTLTMDYFSSKRTDILGARIQSIPTTFGGALPSVNYGIVKSNGVEFDLGYRTNLSKDLSISASFNFGYARNKQVLIDQASNIRPHQSQLGRATGGVFGYVATDIIRTAADLAKLPAGYTINGAVPRLGMLNYKDIRSATTDQPDGKIDANDQEFIYDFSSAPITYGVSLGANWKGFSIDLLLQSLSGFKKMRAIKWYSLGQEGASFEFFKDHWTPENPGGKYPIYGADLASTFWLDDASFIRLKNLNVGYELPVSLTDRLKLGNVKVFFNGINLLLLRDKIKMYDPEGANNAYPINRSYAFGINITL